MAKRKLSVDIAPWATPNFVSVKIPLRHRLSHTDLKETTGVPLAYVDAETLSELCNEFRAEIFRKANKKDPHKAV